MRREAAVVSPSSARITGPTTARGTSVVDARHGTRSPDGQHAHPLELPHSALPSVHRHFWSLVVLCAVGFNVFRTVQYRKLKAHGKASFPSRVRRLDARADGSADTPQSASVHSGSSTDCCRSNPSMPLGLPTGVIQPSASASPGVGAAPREQRRRHLVEPSDPGGVGHRVDPGRYRPLAPGRSTRSVVAVRRLGLPGLGSRRVGLRRGLRRHLRPRGRPGSSAHPVPSSSTASAGILIALPERAYATPRLGRVVLATERRVPDRDGRAAGVAGTRLLAGPRRNADRHGPARWPRRRSPDFCPRGSRPSSPSSPPTGGRSTSSLSSPWPPSADCS